MSFFNKFEGKGGVAKLISVNLASLGLWECKPLADCWAIWLRELETFAQIPLFFQLFLKHQKCRERLFGLLAGQPDAEVLADPGNASKKTEWEQEQKDALQINYKILGEVFQVSRGAEVREKALTCGLLRRILERLSAISGEKPRVYEEQVEEAEAAEQDVAAADSEQTKKAEPVKNTEKKKRKGVGYSSKPGEAFDVTAYLENAKQRNE